MESLTDELYRKLNERRGGRPPAVHPFDVEKPGHHGKRPRNQCDPNVPGSSLEEGGGAPHQGRRGSGRQWLGKNKLRIQSCDNNGRVDVKMEEEDIQQDGRRAQRGRGRPLPQKNRSRSEIRYNSNNHKESYQPVRNATQMSGFRGCGYGGNRTRNDQGCSQGNETGTDDAKTRKPMGFRRLQELSSQSSAQVVTVLANSRSGFEELLQSSMRPDLVILILKVMAKVCKYAMKQNMSAILGTTCHSNFVEGLKQHLFGMMIEDNSVRISGMGDFINNLLLFYETVMKLLPNTASEKFEALFKVTDVMMTGVETHQKINLAIQKEKFSNLQKQLTNMIEERNRDGKKMKSKDELLKFQRPPDDFREKSVFPTVQDIFEEAPFIRPNIVDGAYVDVEHYLDVQFRLLREDFVAPLREGIGQFVSQSNKKKQIDNVRIYRNVIFGDSKVINDQIGVILHFDPEKKLVHTKWEYSKKFMFGSLLCFSNNNFQEILFGTVLEREIKELEKGCITVLLSKETQGQGISLEGPFVMAESETYFEPYQLVLRALQGMTEETFPMYKYIIAVERERRPPQYLEENPFVAYQIDGQNIEVMNRHSWPGEEKLHLDSSQYEAFKAALTEEFVVIQGPPGTGKTFLGLKVAKALLDNSTEWNNGKTPILVVCYTNHALDQFLQGLLSVTEDIVRVGGQSKSEKLASFNLKEKRKQCHSKSASSALRHDLYGRLDTLMTRIKTCQANIEELQKHKGVLQLEDLERANVLSGDHLRCLRPQAVGDLLSEWLGEGFYEMDPDTLDGSDAAAEDNASDAAAEDAAEDAADIEEVEDRIGLYNEPVLESCIVTPTLKYSVLPGQMEQQLSYQESEIKMLSEKEWRSTKEQYMLYERIEIHNQKRLECKYWKSWLKKAYRRDPEYYRMLDTTENLWQLSHEDRWILYKKWVNDYKNFLRKEMRNIETAYGSVFTRYEEAKQTLDFEVMQNSLVVGMTTTMAARMQPHLQALKPKIVIVEEAAEVLEAHIVVSLTKECQHLILIGDHQQLRPSTSVYRLTLHFNFDVSLFERMVKNGIHHHCLGVQHRMRPEIARLIVPTIYPELENHPSVLRYQQVKGVTKSLFFISHSAKEEEVKDIMSHQNIHEAEFILHLCRYLLLQGYQPDEITILATYKGQQLYMRTRQRSMEALKDMKITVVDNFQGEENKIILLSLVRSNHEARIGFLKIENRVCVALSRAREGLFIIGNMDNLVASSTIWPKIKCSLEEQNSLGTALTLQCSVHPHQLTKVSTGRDFVRSVPEGGCSLPCDALLECGHRCQSACHVNNRHHKEYKCHEKCERIPPECSLGHPCTKLCYQTCGKCVTIVKREFPCGHDKQLACHIDHLNYECRVVVKVNLPHCAHSVDKPCFKDIDTFPCPIPCEFRLPCGHSCLRSCHTLDDPDHLEYKCLKPCARKNAKCVQNHICNKLCHEECGICQFEVQKKLPCDHIYKVKCYQDPSEIVCRRQCERILPCGHRCPLSCCAECGGCRKMATKKIHECGHEMKVKCSDIPLHSKCRKPCEKKLECGHDCIAPCGLSCTKKCYVMITSPVPPACGHPAVKIPCFMAETVTPTSLVLLSACPSPCAKELACEHKCHGSCGQCFQGRIHAPCGEKCERPLICGHKCKVPCAAACPPCTERCLYRCRHSRCPKKCGEPCIRCREPCGWHCEHSRCSKLCYEICDKAPCNEPCKKKLKCGHDCIGFCGEPCPPLCRICDKEEVTEIFFGNEDEEDARFVVLVDCQHILEAEGLGQWLAQADQGNDQAITLKTCPKCKSNILKTQRYMNYVKLAFEDVQAVKKKIFGRKNILNTELEQLRRNIAQIKPGMYDFGMATPFLHWLKVLEQCESHLQPVRGNRKNILSRAFIESLSVKVHILRDLKESLTKGYPQYQAVAVRKVRERVTEHFIFLLDVLKSRQRMSKQEVEDFNRECLRFQRITQLAAVRCSTNFEYATTKADIRKLYDDAERDMYSTEIYSPEKDKDVKAKLDQLKKETQCVMLTDTERKEIVRAMNLGQGHWFKCPNGHVYAIGECGGAMEESRCPECKEKIGGTHHHLLETNRLAPEMDGATRHAYEGGLY